MKLYVGNLGDDGSVTSLDLRPLFETYGNVTECECIKNYAFVHMDDEAAATEAVRSLNGSSLKGRTIKVEKSESKGPRKPSQKLFIGNIAEGTSAEDLKELFEQYAAVLETDVIKNFGFVHVDADAGRQKLNEIIRELNGYNLNGNSIRVQLSTSGVRQKPGMGGDQCYRCGRDGHWSKECPQFPDYPGRGFGGRGGGGGGGGRGGPMRGNNPPYGSRGGGGGYSRDPYPPPPPPSYMRERMMGGGQPGYGYDGGYGGGGAYGGARSMDSRGDPYGRGPMNPMGNPPSAADMYDRRGPYPPMGGVAGRDMGGPGPMRGPDPYASRDPYASVGNGGYGADAGHPYSQPAYATGSGGGGGGGGYGGGAGGGGSVGYGAPGPVGAGGATDMYARRSPGPPPSMGASRPGAYGPPRAAPAPAPQGYGAAVGGGAAANPGGPYSGGDPRGGYGMY